LENDSHVVISFLGMWAQKNRPFEWTDIRAVVVVTYAAVGGVGDDGGDSATRDDGLSKGTTLVMASSSKRFVSWVIGMRSALALK